MVFCEQFRLWPTFFEGQNFRIGGAARFSHWTHPTLRLSRTTDECTEVDKCRVEARGAVFRHKLRGLIPKYRATARLVDRDLQVEDARQNASAVGFDDWNRLVERESSDSVSRVFSDSWQFAHLLGCARQPSSMLLYDQLCGGVEISGPSIVAETFPGVKNLYLGSAGERGEIGEATEPLIIIRDNGSDLRLLEHAFGDEDGIGVACAAPGKIAAIATEPA